MLDWQFGGFCSLAAMGGAVGGRGLRIGLVIRMYPGKALPWAAWE